MSIVENNMEFIPFTLGLHFDCRAEFRFKDKEDILEAIWCETELKNNEGIDERLCRAFGEYYRSLNEVERMNAYNRYLNRHEYAFEELYSEDTEDQVYKINWFQDEKRFYDEGMSRLEILAKLEDEFTEMSEEEQIEYLYDKGWAEGDPDADYFYYELLLEEAKTNWMIVPVMIVKNGFRYNISILDSTYNHLKYYANALVIRKKSDSWSDMDEENALRNIRSLMRNYEDALNGDTYAVGYDFIEDSDLPF